MAKFLVIEDNEMNMELVKFLVESSGHECLTAVDGTEGLELAKQNKIDVVLLDIQLPKMDGFEVIEHLRQLPSKSRVPVIAVSSFAMRVDRQRALSAGFNGYITKPIKPAEFMQEVLRTAQIDEGEARS